MFLSLHIYAVVIERFCRSVLPVRPTAAERKVWLMITGFNG